MYSPAPRRGPETASELIISGVFLVLFFGAFAAEIYADFSPTKLSILLVFLFWVPLLFLHEGGHAVVAGLLGWNVRQIVIGMGKTIAGFQLGSARVEIRLVPIEGFVSCVPKRLCLPQLENAVIYFAGPGIELFLAGLILAWFGEAELFSESQQYLVIAMQSLALAATAQAVLNLIPLPIGRPNNVTMYSDGLGMIVSLLTPTSVYRHMIEQAQQEGDVA
jgi:hypothetical protein